MQQMRNRFLLRSIHVWFVNAASRAYMRKFCPISAELKSKSQRVTIRIVIRHWFKTSRMSLALHRGQTHYFQRLLSQFWFVWRRDTLTSSRHRMLLSHVLASVQLGAAANMAHMVDDPRRVIRSVTARALGVLVQQTLLAAVALERGYAARSCAA